MKMARTAQTRTPAPSSGSSAPLIPAVLYLASTLGWAFLEGYAASGFQHGSTTYDWFIESLSDLGVDYRQVHPLKHYAVTSHRFAAQNYNFFQAGAIFAIGQLAILGMTRRRTTHETAAVRPIRALLALLVAGGMLLMGSVHGGPREKFWRTVGWHWNGMTLVSLAGNLNSVLAAVLGNQLGRHEGSTGFRSVSLVLGLGGMYSFYRFMSLPEWDFETRVGLWQRASIYPVLAFELVCAISIIATIAPGTSSKPKRA